MKKMLRMTLAALVCTAALAQNASEIFNKPPEKVDEALRARITEFYQDHLAGKFREAESLVAEDTKDFFYNTNKPRYLGFSIQKIEYSDHFTKAKAMLLSFWDGAEKSALRIDLWTKKMMVDEMADFYYQTFMTMADSYERATQQHDQADELKAFAREFLKKFKAKQQPSK